MKSLYERLIDYLSNIKEDILTGITSKKLERATDFVEKDGKLFFTIERHSRTLGANYHPGNKMSAFFTRNEEYVFDPDLLTIQVIKISTPTIDIDQIDFQALAEEHWQEESLYISENNAGKKILNSSLSKQKIEVNSLIDCQKVVEVICDSIDMSSLIDLLLDNNINEQRELIVKEYQKSLIETGKLHAEEVWNDID